MPILIAVAAISFIVLKLPRVADFLGLALGIFNFVFLSLCMGTLSWSIINACGHESTWLACTVFFGLPFGYFVALK